MATKTKLHPLDELAQGDPKKVIALMLWKARHREPDMYVKIDEKDIEAFDASNNHQKLRPDVLIERPAGLPAQEAIPATGHRRGTPARAATPAKPYLIVTLVERGTKNVIRSVENNQADFDTAQEAGAVRKARDGAQSIADQLTGQMRNGEFSNSVIQDAINSLLILARAQQG